MPSMLILRFLVLAVGCCAAVFHFAPAAWGQGRGEQPAVVRYTEALEAPVEQSAQLPGRAEAPHSSVLASEVAGLVTALKAREGDRVAQGQILATLQTTSLELSLAAARGRLKEAQANQQLAARRLERSRRLREAETISRQTLDESQYDFDALQGRIEALRATLASIEFDIKRSVIRSPFNGIVVARHTEVGQWSDVGAAVLEVMSTEAMEVHVDVPERYFGALEAGGAVTVAFDSLPGRNYEAVVRAVVPRADPKAHTFPVKLRLNAPDGTIGEGMLARATFSLGRAEAGLLVPKDAIVRQGPRTLVYLIERGVAAPVPVETVAAMGLWSVVRGALAPGAKVITRGNERLQPGQPVSGEPISYPPP